MNECQIKPFGPKYPRLEGLEKFRRTARISSDPIRVQATITREEKHAYGDAVGAAIRKLQYTELMRVLTPSSDRPSIPKTPSPLMVKYSTPNPFPMVGDPPATNKERTAGPYDEPRVREERLYRHALKHALHRMPWESTAS